MDIKAHWETIYQTKKPTEVSWYQQNPQKSLDLIKVTGISQKGQILDVGGGASTLVDHLLNEGTRSITVLDISSVALTASKARLGPRASPVTWMEGNITQVNLPSLFFDVWHDRAVFHFLTDVNDRRRYIDNVRVSLKPGGHLIIATFASDGPERCSGLDVVRYSAESLQKEFGSSFQLITSVKENHQTPFGTEQRFIYC